MNMRSTKVHIALLLSMLFFACREKPEFSNIPYIKYSGFDALTNREGKDSVGFLRLYFTDGDGDMGLSASDTLPPYNKESAYYYNFFIDYYEKQNGVWTKVVLPPPFPGADSLTNNSRIPNLTPEGPNKTLEGEIKMQLFTNNPFSTFDTIRYEVRICDRALNMSNTVRTPDFILRK
jgi:hypothetical protein